MPKGICGANANPGNCDGAARRRQLQQLSPLQENSQAKQRILSVAPSRRGKRQPALGGRDEVVARGQIRFYETSSPEGRRGQKELGGESKRPPKEDQGRVCGGKTATAGSRAGAPTEVVSGAPDQAPPHTIPAPPRMAERRKVERDRIPIREWIGAQSS